MKTNIIEYKGYYARIEYSVEDRVLFGKIEGIRDLVNFESESAKDIEEEFRNAVDDYLDFCKSVGKNPDKSYKGTFNVRISPNLHRQIAEMAFQRNMSLNSWVEEALNEHIKDDMKEKDIKKINIEDRGGVIVSGITRFNAPAQQYAH
ncbi:hypothetical protein EUBC25_04680 [Claveliimonas bilis]|uniref:type II toxin-antitoxin system HicB family antitoxin n=1 Tax=Claveliimonas bilis TaxID=3028070 RepID=UPI001E454195|nr:type II toxin-antitoxin system HicB family antitoxin [Claveliimonas bilis]BCZ26381.1 hypothetical protein EUBC25_04680 [Claveliimonas bilis]